jgi:hypothetical protein
MRAVRRNRRLFGPAPRRAPARGLAQRAAPIALALLTTAQAHAFQVTLDATLLGDSPGNYVSISRCGINTTIVDSSDAIRTVDGGGIGLAGGGSNDSEIDGGERLHFSFPAGAARSVSYSVSSASNQDGDGLFGECFVRASNGGGEIGIEPVAGVGAIDVSALFGGVPIGGLLLTSAPDGVRIGRISYRAPPAPNPMYLARLGGSHASAEVTQCGITFRGAPGFAHLNTDGVGVVGGAASSWIDAGEELEVDFGEPVAGVRYELEALEIVGPGTIGGHFVQAFDAQGASLGVHDASAADWVDLASPSFYGDVPISRFVLFATGDQIRLERVELVPEPADAGAAPLLALVALRAGRRRAAP